MNTHNALNRKRFLDRSIKTLSCMLPALTQIIWAMISREYLGILIVSLPPAVSYIYTISPLQKKPVFPSSNSLSHFPHTLLFLPMNSFKPLSKRFPFLLFSHLILIHNFLQLLLSLTLLIPFGSVPNRPGPLQGPADGLPRALDGTGRRNMSRPRPENQKTTVISKDSRTGNLRQYLS